MVQAPPARGAVTSRKSFSASSTSSLPSSSWPAFQRTSLPTRVIWRATSEEASLTPGQARCLARAREPFLELFPWNSPDPTDPHRRNAGWIWVVHRAESAQDGRGVDAEPPRDFFRREELLTGGIDIKSRSGCCHCGSCLGYFYERHVLRRILTALAALSRVLRVARASGGHGREVFDAVDR